MDPNEALKVLRKAVSDYEDTRGRGHDDPMTEAADEMRDGIRALDDWLSSGGFKPDAWN